MRNWNEINGPVVVLDYMDQRIAFDNLYCAVWYFERFREHITDEYMSYISSDEFDNRYDRNQKPLVPYSYFKDTKSLLFFFDELGFRIPVWRIRQEYDKLGSKKTFYRTPERGSVIPHTGHCKRHYRRGKAARTFPELRDNEFLYWDEELKEYGIRPRVVRTGFYLPNSYETRHYASDIRCWKRYRKHQWKVSRVG